MAGKIVLETSRLYLREMTEADAAFMLKLLNSEGWLKYIGDKKIYTTKAAADHIRDGYIKSYRENGFGLYLMEEKTQNTPMGICGLIRRKTLPDVDIGFALLPEYEGHGYAFEAAKACLDFAWINHNLKRIVAITTAANKPSQKLLEKLGLAFEKNIVFEKDEELMLYAIRPFLG
jgi:ribosomal-protein-alanine N-acetyltransferase